MNSFLLFFCSILIVHGYWFEEKVNKIDSQVFEALKNYRNANILIILKQQVKWDEIVNENGINVKYLDHSTRGQLVLSTVQKMSETTQGGISAFLHKSRIRHESYYAANFIAAWAVPRELVEEISNFSEIWQIQSNAQVTVEQEPHVELFTSTKNRSIQPEWNLHVINVTDVWKLGFDGRGIVVGGSDSGVAFEHPALVSNYRGNQGNGKFDHNYSWYDGFRSGNCGACACGSPNPCDHNNHGTLTIGTAIGGKDRAIGVAPGAKWIACRSQAGNATNVVSYLNCLQFFLAPHDLDGKNPKPELRPHTTGHSYGCRMGDAECRHQLWIQIIDAMRASGIMVVASAGNAGSRCGTVKGPPGKLHNVLTVGATAKDKVFEITTFSSRGPVLGDGSRRMKPDLCAPGQNVTSAVPPNVYGTSSGTSHSCPAINGCVALLWSAVPQLARNLDLTQRILQESARHQTTSQCDPQEKSPNNVYGHGSVNLLKAYELARQFFNK